MYCLGLEVNTGNRARSIEEYGERVISCLSDQGNLIPHYSALHYLHYIFTTQFTVVENYNSIENIDRLTGQVSHTFCEGI